MKDIKIRSLNINGIRNKKKRLALFNMLKRQNFDIVCLQETYIIDSDIELWEKEWGGRLFHCSGTTRSKGQIILVKNNFPFKVSCIKKESRLLAIEAEIDDKTLHIVNAYAPIESAEKQSFFKNLTRHFQQLDTDHVIFCGDMNCVIKNALDIVSGGNHAESDIECFNEFINNCGLSDVWRLFNGEEKIFTWSRNSPNFIARRLDYILASECAVDNITECNIKTIAQTDHRCVDISYRLSDIVRGPSYWKFNDSLLTDINYVNMINSLIDEYNTEHSHEIDQNKWDMLKIEIKEISIAFSKEKQRNKRNNMTHIQNKLDLLDKQISKNPEDQVAIKTRESLKKELEIFNTHIARGAHIRARTKFIADGEKNTAYFLGLEKTQGNLKTLDKIRKDDGQIVTNHTDIMTEITRFYKQRYTKTVEFSETAAEHFLQNTNIPKITDEERENLEGLLTEDEIGEALKGLNNGSAPGADGLTSSFYKFFWSRIKTIVQKSINLAFVNGEMSTSQKKAIVTLIHKGKDLPKEDLNNWRPISLTNTDYKIMAKAIANRLSKVINKLIEPDQVGFMKGRNISSIIRTIDDTIRYLSVKDKPGIIFALDYKAAFDTISKDFIIWSFKQFNFGEDFIKWVTVLMKNTNSSINYHGWISSKIEVDTGIRQGCPFSPMAFILALELIAIRIRSDPTIKGIRLPKGLNQEDCTLKVQLYADDITLLLQDKHDLKNALTLVNYFSKFSGLAMNRNKSEGMWVGSNAENMDEPYNLKWTKQVKILGIYFNNETPASEIEKNWSGRIEKINQIICRWYKRNLSLMAKICITKSLLISQIVHILQSLSMPEHVLTKINTILFRFIWKKKYTNTKAFEKIKRRTICKDTENGGLSMINIKDMQNSFLLTWVTKLRNDKDEKWKRIPIEEMSKLGSNLSCFLANNESKKFKGLNTIYNPFWKSVLKCWLDNLKELNLEVSKRTEFENQLLWNNVLITYRNDTLFFKDWVNAGITTTNDITTNGDIKSLEEICIIIGNKPSRYFEYGAIKTAITNLKSKKLNDLQVEANNKINVPYTPQEFRKYLINKDKTEPKAADIWRRRLGLNIDTSIWLAASNCTKETRLRLLHYKILYGIYPTNKLLFKMGEADSINCKFCVNTTDTLEHFFYECDKIRQIWKLAEKEIHKRTGIRHNIILEEAIVGKRSGTYNKSITNMVNHILLIAKMCIGIFRYGTPINIQIMFEREIEIRKLDKI